MSGPKTSTVRYVPTEADRRAAARQSLRDQHRRAERLAARARTEAASWAKRAPQAAKHLEAFVAPTVDLHATDPLGALVRDRVAVDAAERRVAELVAAAAAEEARRRARAQVDAAEVDAARRSAASVVVLPGIAATDGDEDEQPEPSRPVPTITPTATRVPDVDQRLDRVASILDRAAAPPEAAVVAALLDEAARATDELRFHSVLQRARRAVASAVAADEARQRTAEEARSLLASIGDLRSAELDAWRRRLVAAADGDEPLESTAPLQVRAALAAATRQRFLEVVVALGCELAPESDDRVLGYIDQGGGTASKVLVDERGVVLTPVSASPLDEGSAASLDERNCELHRKIAERAAGVGLEVTLVSARGVGGAPVRMEPHPFATGEPSVEAGGRRSSVTEGSSRRDRRRRIEDKRSNQR